MQAVDALPHKMESGQAAVLSGVVEQGVIFPKDETLFRCMHHATSQSSLPSWVHTFASAGLSGRCCSPGTAAALAGSQRLTGSLVYPVGLPIQMDPSSIPSDSFHGAHMDITTLQRVLRVLPVGFRCATKRTAAEVARVVKQCRASAAFAKGE